MASWSCPRAAVKFVDQVEKWSKFQIRRRRPRVKSCGRRRPGARFRGSGGRRGEGARRFRAGARERLDQGPGRPRRFYRIGRRPGPAVGADERGRGVAKSGAVPARARRAVGAVSIEGRLRPTRTAKSEAWLVRIEAERVTTLDDRGARGAVWLGDDVVNDLLERHVAVVGEDLDQKAEDAIATIWNDGPAISTLRLRAAASKRVDAALRSKTRRIYNQRRRRPRQVAKDAAPGRRDSGVEMDVEKLFAKEENHVANVKDDVTTGAASRRRCIAFAGARRVWRHAHHGDSTRSSSGTGGGSTPAAAVCARRSTAGRRAGRHGVSGGGGGAGDWRGGE